MVERMEFDSGMGIGSSPDCTAWTRALDDLRHALCRHDNQLHGSPGDRDSQAHPPAQHRHDGGELRLHRRCISDRLRAGPAGRRAADDKVGTRIGYMFIMAVWSLSAMGHALANTVLEFGIARFFLGLGESGNFPAAIKTVAEWFPQNERSLATGIFNSGANVGAILAPIIVPWVTLRYGWHAAFLSTGLFSALWILWWFRNYRKPTEHPTLSERRTAHIQPGSGRWRWARPHPGASCWAIARPGPFPREVPYRSDLVVLFVLAAVLLQREIQSESFASWAAAHYRL
jgi:MFS family permease